MPDPALLPDASPVLGLPYIQPAQAQKHVTHNEALRLLDVAVQLAVADRDRIAPPPDPAMGDRHIVPAGATLDWAGQAGRVALWEGAGWAFLDPRPGWRAWVAAEGAVAVFDGAAWQGPEAQGARADSLGIGTPADAVNRLAVAAPAVLLTHQGAGHQVKVNKAAPGDTASLLFQTGFSGRAEMGTAGSDAFAVKVSADGTAWFTALVADPATGRTALPGGLEVTGAVTGTAVTQAPADATAGRLLKVGDSATLLSASPASRLAAGGTANAIAVTTGAGFVGVPPVGLQIRFRPAASNTGPATLALDGGAGRPCVTVTGAALPAGYVRTDADTLARFDGTAWVLDRAPERGANAGGDYRRLADGTQICTRSVTASLALDVAAFGGFRCAYQTWTFPLAFAAPPVVLAAATGGTAAGANVGAVTATAAGWAATAFTTQPAAARTVSLTAQGLWF